MGIRGPLYGAADLTQDSELGFQICPRLRSSTSA